MKQVNVGIIGLGEVAQIIHLPILQALSDQFRIRAVCDISPGLLQAVGDRYGIEHSDRYDDPFALVRRADLDAVFVLNSDEYHGDCVIAAARSGKHVLVEKPMCLTFTEAEVRRAGIVASRRSRHPTRQSPRRSRPVDRVHR